MGITVSDRLRTGKYLGYPLAHAASGTIETALARIEALGDVYVEEVQNLLHELDKVQSDIDSSRLGAGRSFQSGAAGTAQFFRGERLNELRMAGRQQVNYLSQMTGLAVMADVFSPAAAGKATGRVTRM